jgi:hemerythrin
MSTVRNSPTRPRAICAALRHRRKMLCRRIAAIAAGPDDMVAQGFAALVAAVEAAFRHEELIMETLGYGQLHEHRAENAIVLSALHRVLPDVERGDCMLGRQVLAALGEVLALHRLKGDLALTVAAQPADARVRGRAARATLHVATHRPHVR